MTTHITNRDDVIDSRSIIERLDELNGERQALADAVEDAEDAREALEEWDAENGDELKALNQIAEEADGYCEDWRHGATLIRESYFVDYCKELVTDIGDLPRGLPNYIVIDWDATAENIKADYTEVDFDGVTYYVR